MAADLTDRTVMENLLKDGNDAVLRKAEWYWMADRFNSMCTNLSELLIKTTLKAPPSLGLDNWLTKGVILESSHIESVSGLLAILGVTPSPRAQDLYKKLKDPEGSGLHLARTQAITDGKGLVDERGNTIVFPENDVQLFNARSLFQFTSTMEMEEQKWWNQEGTLDEDGRSVMVAQAAELFVKLTLWGQMAGSHEPAIHPELQAFVAQVNAMEEDHHGFVASLKEQIHRRELDLLQIYLKTHPHAVVPPEVQAELDTIAGGPGRDAEVARRLTEIRTEEHLQYGTEAMRGDPAENPR